MYEPSKYCQKLMGQKTSASLEFHAIFMRASCQETGFEDNDMNGLSSNWDELLACGTEFKNILETLLEPEPCIKKNNFKVKMVTNVRTY